MDDIFQSFRTWWLLINDIFPSKEDCNNPLNLKNIWIRVLICFHSLRPPELWYSSLFVSVCCRTLLHWFCSVAVLTVSAGRSWGRCRGAVATWQTMSSHCWILPPECCDDHLLPLSDWLENRPMRSPSDGWWSTGDADQGIIILLIIKSNGQTQTNKVKVYLNNFWRPVCGSQLTNI